MKFEGKEWVETDWRTWMHSEGNTLYQKIDGEDKHFIEKKPEPFNETTLAMWMHDNYEEISKEENWDTQASCKVTWDNLPSCNRRVMIKLAKRLIKELEAQN